jgi:hypothetical protein
VIRPEVLHLQGRSLKGAALPASIDGASERVLALIFVSKFFVNAFRCLSLSLRKSTTKKRRARRSFLRFLRFFVVDFPGRMSGERIGKRVRIPRGHRHCEALNATLCTPLRRNARRPRRLPLEPSQETCLKAISATLRMKERGEGVSRYDTIRKPQTRLIRRV